jgi:DNA polymerase-3 subunit epsilon
VQTEVPRRMFPQPLVVLDFETTGLRPERGDRITEVGLVRIEGDRISERYQSLVNCGVRVPRFVTTYTGITQQMVDAAPPVAQVMREIVAFIGDTAVIAHCANFDQAFYLRECWRQHMSRSVFTAPFICSMRLARRIYPHAPGHSLAVLRHVLGLECDGIPHRAASDAEMTAQLMLRLARDMTDMNDGIAITAKVLRQVMEMPVATVRVEIERLCA